MQENQEKQEFNIDDLSEEEKIKLSMRYQENREEQEMLEFNINDISDEEKIKLSIQYMASAALLLEHAGLKNTSNKINHFVEKAVNDLFDETSKLDTGKLDDDEYDAVLADIFNS